MFLACESGIRDRFVFDCQGLDGAARFWSGMAASRKMAVILEAWLPLAEERVRAEDGARFLLLFGAVRGVWGTAMTKGNYHY